MVTLFNKVGEIQSGTLFTFNRSATFKCFLSCLNTSVSVFILAVFRASNGQDCCPDGGWGELLRKDGDPVYEDKGVVEKGTNLPSFSTDKCHHIIFHSFSSFSVSVSGQLVTVTDDQSGQTSSEEDELDGDSRDHSHKTSTKDPQLNLSLPFILCF